MGRFSFFTSKELKAAGETIASIRASIEHGERYRVIAGWYGDGSTPKDAVLAMRMGGRLGCVSALALHGGWLPPDAGVHVVFPTHASGRRSADRQQSAAVVRHWHRSGVTTGSAFAVAPLELAIADAIECQPPHYAIAILDSLLHRRRISRNRLEAILLRGGTKVQHLREHLEPTQSSSRAASPGSNRSLATG